jgi:hypothetical protein
VTITRSCSLFSTLLFDAFQSLCYPADIRRKRDKHAHDQAEADEFCSVGW